MNMNQDEMAQLRLLLSATSQLPKFKAEKGELWRSFETTFRLKRQNTGLSLFPLLNQKMTLLGCLDGKAAQAHVLCEKEWPPSMLPTWKPSSTNWGTYSNLQLNQNSAVSSLRDWNREPEPPSLPTIWYKWWRMPNQSPIQDKII